MCCEHVHDLLVNADALRIICVSFHFRLGNVGIPIFLAHQKMALKIILIGRVWLLAFCLGVRCCKLISFMWTLTIHSGQDGFDTQSDVFTELTDGFAQLSSDPSGRQLLMPKTWTAACTRPQRRDQDKMLRQSRSE